ncbi:hypothetical protein [Kordia sp.]|uniref:hypothetical protein n=1 Tax=Kordia sp. TaxID=1965332 RepID=UPI003D6C509E
MSQKQKYIFWALFLTVGMFFNACQKDYVEDIPSESDLKDFPFTSRLIAKSEYQQNQNLVGRLQSFTSVKGDQPIFQKDHYDAQNEITVHTNQAKYIEYANGNLHSYTFKISRTDSSEIENLTLALNADTGEYDAYLVQYVLDDTQTDELMTYNHISTYYSASITPLEGDFSDLLNKSTGQPCDYQITTYHTIPIGTTYEFQEGDTCDHPPGSEGGTCYVYTVIEIICPEDVPNIDPNTSTGAVDNNNSSDNTSTSGGGGNSNSGTDNDLPNDPDVVTQPFFDLNEQNDLNKLREISATPIIKARLDDFRARVSTDFLERASEFRTQADGTYYEHQISQDSLEFSGSRFSAPLTNSKVRVHLHHDNVNADGEAIAPVPSAEDVFGMSDFFKEKVNFNASDSLDIVSIVVSRRDLYAFKIRDAEKVSKFREDLDRIFIVDGDPKKYSEILEEAYKKDVENRVVKYCQSQGGCSPALEEAVWESYFLQYLQRLDSGLSFFRAFHNPQTDTYDWQPLN